MDLFHQCLMYSACMLLCGASNVHAEEVLPADEELGYQERLLLHPTPKQLDRETDGRVRIYDSLDMNTINAALDRQFSRIENMMFVRIHHLPPAGAGTANVEDDGCD